MKILVTGSNGFIGRNLCKKLQMNHEVIGIDRKKIYENDQGIIGSIQTARGIPEVDLIIHLASDISISESIDNPGKYYTNNINSTIAVANLAKKWNIPVHFASSAAVYGIGDNGDKTENQTLNPNDPYGKSKMMSEQILKDIVPTCIIFRYFNVVGPGYYRNPPEHVIPILHETLKNEKTFEIYGKNLPTSDGTCERDFIHVEDVINAHILALNNPHSATYNICSGIGTSILKLYNTMKEIYPISKSTVLYKSKRGFDPARLVGNNSLAKKRLGWFPERTLHEMIIDS